MTPTYTSQCKMTLLCYNGYTHLFRYVLGVMHSFISCYCWFIYLQPANKLDQGDWLSALLKHVGNGGVPAGECQDIDDLTYTYVDSRSLGSLPSDNVEVSICIYLDFNLVSSLCSFHCYIPRNYRYEQERKLVIFSCNDKKSKELFTSIVLVLDVCLL